MYVHISIGYMYVNYTYVYIYTYTSPIGFVSLNNLNTGVDQRDTIPNSLSLLSTGDWLLQWHSNSFLLTFTHAWEAQWAFLLPAVAQWCRVCEREGAQRCLLHLLVGLCAQLWSPEEKLDITDSCGSNYQYTKVRRFLNLWIWCLFLCLAL